MISMSNNPSNNSGWPAANGQPRQNGTASPVDGTAGNPSGNGNRALNVNANEFIPSFELSAKMNLPNPNAGDRGGPVTDLQQYRGHVRTCLLQLCSDESQYAARVDDLTTRLQAIAFDRTGAMLVVAELVGTAEDDFHRATIASRLANSLLYKLRLPNGEPSMLEACLAERVAERSRSWAEHVRRLCAEITNGSVGPHHLAGALAFAQLVAELCTTVKLKEPTLPQAFVLLMEALLQANTPASVVGSAIRLLESATTTLVDDIDAETSERVIKLLRQRLVRGSLTEEDAYAGLAALERWAAEIATRRVYTQLNLSRQPSEVGDDVYDEYEKFLAETGQ